MPLFLHQVKDKDWRGRGGGLDWILQSQFQRLFRSWGVSAPSPGLSYPMPRRTRCCHKAAVGPDASAPAPLPRCPCCPRCRGVETGDIGRKDWGRGRWPAVGWEGGPHLS